MIVFCCRASTINGLLPHQRFYALPTTHVDRLVDCLWLLCTEDVAGPGGEQQGSCFQFGKNASRARTSCPRVWNPSQTGAGREFTYFVLIAVSMLLCMICFKTFDLYQHTSNMAPHEIVWLTNKYFYQPNRFLALSTKVSRTNLFGEIAILSKQIVRPCLLYFSHCLAQVVE